MTATTISPATIDPAILTQLELAFAGGDLPPECELCDAPPSWWFITLPCGCRHALCNPHKDVSCRKFLIAASGRAIAQCIACLTCVNGIKTEPLS